MTTTSMHKNAVGTQAHYGKVAGLLESVDPAQRKVEIKTNEGSMRSFMLEPNAKFKKNGRRRP
jgi:hypothetical protein